MTSGKPDSPCKWCAAGLPRIPFGNNEFWHDEYDDNDKLRGKVPCTATRKGGDRRKQERRKPWTWGTQTIWPQTRAYWNVKNDPPWQACRRSLTDKEDRRQLPERRRNGE